MPFLLSLPVRRKTLWGVKVLSASGALLPCLFASGCVWAAMDRFAYGSEMLHGDTFGVAETVAVVMAFAFMTLLLAMTLSLFLGRTSGALMATIIMAPGIFMGLVCLADWGIQTFFPSVSDDGDYSPTDALPFLLAGVFGVVFHAVFVHGGSLTTTRRFRVGAIAGGAAFLIASMAFVAVAPAIAHFR